MGSHNQGQRIKLSVDCLTLKVERSHQDHGKAIKRDQSSAQRKQVRSVEEQVKIPSG